MGKAVTKSSETLCKCSGHMTKVGAMPIYINMVKTFENPLLKNQKSYDLETWHVAWWTQAL